MRFLYASVLCAVFYTALGSCPQGLCPSSQTCCDGPSEGLYGCCPEPNAVCCSDGLHCCPQNTVCDLAQGTCDDQVKIPDIFKRKRPEFQPQAAVMYAARASTVTCPGGEYYCQDGNTCCLLQSGEYGCCPYPSAVCCADEIHCCPSGTHCDQSSTYCLQGPNRYLSLFKRPAFPMK